MLNSVSWQRGYPGLVMSINSTSSVTLDAGSAARALRCYSNGAAPGNLQLWALQRTGQPDILIISRDHLGSGRGSEEESRNISNSTSFSRKANVNFQIHPSLTDFSKAKIYSSFWRENINLTSSASMVFISHIVRL